MLLKAKNSSLKRYFAVPKFDFPETLALDTRSLAVLRIAIGLLILADLLERSQDLVAHYTDLGVMPLSLSISKYLTAGTWSLFLINGEVWTTGLLFVITGICAIGLISGYRTKLFTFLCWLLVGSLQARNMMTLNGGDNILRLVLFWGMFLPLGASFSIDRIFNPDQKTPHQFMNMAAIAYTLQIAYIYWFAFLWKANPVWLSEFRGAYYAIQMDFFASPLGHWLRNFPDLMPTFDIATLVIELGGPFLLFIPSKKYAWIFRSIAIVTFILLHFSFGSFLEIGIFAWICAATWLAFIPSQIWDKLQVFGNTPERSPQTKPVDLGDVLLPTMHAIGNLDNEGIANNRKTESKFTQVLSFSSVQTRETFFQKCLIASLIILILFMNIENLRMRAWNASAPPFLPTWIANVLRINQTWSMFAPVPMRRDGWFVVMGTLNNGSAANLINPDQTLTWEKPTIPSEIYKNVRWRKYYFDLWQSTWSNSQSEIDNYIKYQCRAWNQNHSNENQLQKVQVSFMEEFTLPDFAISPIEQRVLKESLCD
jgi:hypothetical protein